MSAGPAQHLAAPLLEKGRPLLSLGAPPPVCQQAPPPPLAGSRHFWPCKNSDINRTGASEVQAPRDLSRPVWALDVPNYNSHLNASFWSKTWATGAGLCFAGVGGMMAGMGAGLLASSWAPLGGSTLLTCLGAGIVQLVRSKAKPWSFIILLSSPVIDQAGNIYIVKTNGELFSLRPDGSQRWAITIPDACICRDGSGQVPTPALLRDGLVIADGKGTALKISLDSGEIVWRSKYTEDGSDGSGTDSWSVVANDEIALVIGMGPKSKLSRFLTSGDVVFALSLLDGSTRWTYACLAACPFNFMPALAGDRVVFAHSAGGATCLDLRSGDLRWQVPAEDPQSMTTGGAATGPNGVVYVTCNVDCTALKHPGRGLLAAYELDTGKVRWKRYFDKPYEANAAPTVFRPGGRSGGGPLLVATGLGSNACFPWPVPAIWGRRFEGLFIAVNAESGETVWTFEPPPLLGRSSRASTMFNIILPDAWTNAAVSDSTVYVSWHDGTVYALDAASGAKVSSYDMESAAQGAPAIAPGRVVVAAAERLFTFS